MPIESPNFQSVIELLRRHNITGLIAVDGFDGVGKTTLSKQIATALECLHIDFDGYVSKNSKGEYFEYLNHHKLNKDIRSKQGESSILVLSGVCMNRVLARNQLTPAYKIYVKKQKVDGIWHDGFYIDGEIVARDYHSTLDIELLNYHREYRPHEVCDCLLQQWFDVSVDTIERY